MNSLWIDVRVRHSCKYKCSPVAHRERVCLREISCLRYNYVRLSRPWACYILKAEMFTSTFTSFCCKPGSFSLYFIVYSKFSEQGWIRTSQSQWITVCSWMRTSNASRSESEWVPIKTTHRWPTYIHWNNVIGDLVLHTPCSLWHDVPSGKCKN